jgi:AcrR family transcriptional regulator
MFTRARRDENKQERREAVLAAALAVWNETTWSAFTMADVAERAGIVKGTVYLYYATKEALFLALLGRLMGQYFDAVDAKLAEGGRWSPKRVARVLATELSGREALTRMLPLLGGVLEQNIEYDAALAFKRVTLERFDRTAERMERRAALRRGDGMRVLLRASALLTGLANMAFPAPVIERVFENEPSLRVLRIDLSEEFEGAVCSLLEAESLQASRSRKDHS